MISNPICYNCAGVGTLSDARRAHAICEEYRAAATIDRRHDEADRADGRRIECPLLVLWSASGALGSFYQAEGGPIEIWRKWADDVCGQAVPRGHFFPEEAPELTAELLLEFLRGDRRSSSDRAVQVPRR